MPTQNRVRLDNARQTKQAWPKPSHPYQQCPVAPTELPLGCTPQGNIELMPKKDILKLKSAPRLEQVGDNCPKQMEHRDHRVDDELILPYRANRPDGIFGNDRVLPPATSHDASRWPSMGPNPYTRRCSQSMPSSRILKSCCERSSPAPLVHRRSRVQRSPPP